MTDDRSERLRRRRKRSTENIESERQPSPAREDGQSNRQSNPSNETNDGLNSSGDDSVSVKEERVGTYMYLPGTQTKELRRLYNVLKAEYEFTYDDEFEKNRHFYPLVIQYGLAELEGLDASEIRTRLEEIS